MGKLLASAASGLCAVVTVLVMGQQPAWGQVEGRICDLSNNPSACDQCYTRAGDNQQAQCECLCKWVTPQEMSRNECLTDLCGTESGGFGGKIGSGPVFRGEVYASTADALVAANQFVVDNDLSDNVNIVLKDFYNLTHFADSYLVHLVGSPFVPNGTGNTVVMMGNFQCSAGINQDGNPFSAGCQSGLGCYEIPKSRWVAAGCPTTMGCCNSDAGCPARTGGPDTLPNNGYYGTNGAGCPTGTIP